MTSIGGYDWNGRKVLVTGASGFKGSWLCAALMGLGAKVYGTISNHRHPLSAFEMLEIDDRVARVAADVSNRQQVYDLLNSIEPDVVFHLAAKALVPVSLRDPRRTFEVNFEGTLNLIQACRTLRICKRLLICSTDHVFGNVEPEELPNGGFDEKSRVSYSGPYDTSKSAMELMVRCYHSTYWSELPAIGITRCANVFGFGDTNQRRVIPLFVRSAVCDHVIPLKYSMSGRQFIHVTDAIIGYIKAAASLDEGGIEEKRGKTQPEDRSPFTPTYHFAIENYEGTSDPYIRMGDLAHHVAGIFGARVDQSHCVPYPRAENKIQALKCRVTRDSLQWNTVKPFSTALKELGEWYTSESSRPTLKNLIHRDLEHIVSVFR